MQAIFSLTQGSKLNIRITFMQIKQDLFWEKRQPWNLLPKITYLLKHFQIYKGVDYQLHTTINSNL